MMLDLCVESGDQILRNHFQSCSGNATYRSKTTQNELINCCREHILERLLAKIKKGQVFLS